MSHPGHNMPPATLRRTGAGRRGFTLIEALAALAVLAIVLPLAMRGISLAVMLGSDARKRTTAVQLAQSKLEELTATSAWRNGTLSGDFGEDWPDYRWTLVVGQWSHGAMDQLDLQVDWNSRGKDRSVTLSTLVSP